jgi:uncharacterized membrane protein YqhA
VFSQVEIILLIGGVLVIILLPPFLLFIRGLKIKKTNPDRAKILFIIAIVYLIIGFGICARL